MKKHNNNQWICVGKIGRSHGIKGFVTIQSFTEPPANIMHYLPWYDKNKKPLKIIECKRLGSKIIALFDEKTKPETHTELWIERTQLPTPQKGEYYWTDLIGLEVYSVEKKYLGQVVRLFSTGANDVVVVKKEHQKKELLIPYVPQHTILDIDLTQGVMQVDWHEI